MLSATNYGEISRTWIDEWLLGKIITNALRDLGSEEHLAWRSVGIIKILNSQQDWYDKQVPRKLRSYRALKSWLSVSEIHQFLGVNRYQDILWFNKESFEELIWWMFTISLIEISATDDLTNNVTAQVIERYDIIRALSKAAKETGYQIEGLLNAIKN